MGNEPRLLDAMSKPHSLAVKLVLPTFKGPRSVDYDESTDVAESIMPDAGIEGVDTAQLKHFRKVGLGVG